MTENSIIDTGLVGKLGLTSLGGSVLGLLTDIPTLTVLGALLAAAFYAASLVSTIRRDRRDRRESASLLRLRAMRTKFYDDRSRLLVAQREALEAGRLPPLSSAAVDALFDDSALLSDLPGADDEPPAPTDGVHDLKEPWP